MSTQDARLRRCIGTVPKFRYVHCTCTRLLERCRRWPLQQQTLQVWQPAYKLARAHPAGRLASCPAGPSSASWPLARDRFAALPHQRTYLLWQRIAPQSPPSPAPRRCARRDDAGQDTWAARLVNVRSRGASRPSASSQAVRVQSRCALRK